LGETFRGNRQSRVAPSRRAQAFDPDAEPNRRGQKKWDTILRERKLQIRFQRPDRQKNANGAAAIGNVRGNAKWNYCTASPGVRAAGVREDREKGWATKDLRRRGSNQNLSEFKSASNREPSDGAQVIDSIVKWR
jgi:hypothetical protein